MFSRRFVGNLLLFLAATVVFGETPNDALLSAVLDGKADKVKTLLEKEKADPNTADREGTTALMLAAYGGDAAIVKLLLAKGADIKAKDKEDTTALMFAAFKGRTEIVKILLDKGADVKAQQKDGWTALIGATLGGHAGVVKLLKAAGAEADPEAIQKLRRDMAGRILNECRQADAAKDQYALENSKTGTVTPDWSDLTPYLKAGSKLANGGGCDSLGNPMIIGNIQTRLQVNPQTKDALKSVADDYFWGPYS